MIGGSNLYVRLGVPRDATPEEIRGAYFEAARQLHPDTNPDPEAPELFLQVQQAYDVLSNPEKRRQYDAMLPAQEHSSPSISVNTLYSRTSLPQLAEPQLVYVLMELTSIPDPAVNVAPPLNLCLILDRSTSMAGARMDMVKSNAIALLRQMRPQDLISIVTFSDRAEVLIPATRISDLSRIESKISMLQTGGGTEILHGLEEGIGQVRRNLNSSYINHVILLTDGRTYGDEDACLKLAEASAQQGIGISGLGIGHEWNDAFLDNIASISGGSSMYVSAPKELHKFLEQKFNSLGKIYAEQVTLDYETDENVELRFAFRIQPESGPLTTKCPIRVGNIVQFQSLSILLEFMVKDLSNYHDEVILARGKVKMDIPTRSVPHTRFNFQIVRPVSPDSDPEPPPNEIVQALSRLTLYRMQDRARNEVAAGEIKQATKHLHYLATHLLSQGERELAHTVLVEAEHVHHSQQFSKEGDKRIKYGTRALLLPSGPEYKKV
ncbi:MAG TPA: DnaJ domain-containing protein [Anaerolineaceae bacterium]|nr:DnaJ domain-containing protein [Anaerolineaceae bacterium]